MGQSPIPLLSMEAVKSRKKGVCIPVIWVRKGQGLSVAMGRSPIPLLSMEAVKGGKKGGCIPVI